MVAAGKLVADILRGGCVVAVAVVVQSLCEMVLHRHQRRQPVHRHH